MYCIDCNPTASGREYVGHVAVTENGRTCQAWSAQSPHSHNYNNDTMYADGSQSDARNYCRNPDADFTGLFCYTTDPRVRWERCNVPPCGQSFNIGYYCPGLTFCSRTISERIKHK